ncbi:MAG: Ig-like domain-containing protein, partial [Phycisphaerales bacterium]
MSRSLRAVVIAAVGLVVLVAAGAAQATPTITTVSNVKASGNNAVASPLSELTLVVSNNTPSTLNSQYLGFKVANDSTARSDLWITISNVAGGSATLAPTEDGVAHVGALAANASTFVYFYFRSSAVTTTDTTFRINAFEGPPTAGGTTIDLDTSSANTWAAATIMQVVGTQNASANKVLSGYISPAAPVLGATFQVVVNGDTGQLKQSGDVVFTPAFGSTWDASKFELVSTRIKFDTDNATYNNQLAFLADTNAGTNQIRKAGQTYTATYTFRAVDQTSANVRATPVGALQSGNLLKYTNASSLALIPPIQPVTNSFVIDARVSPALSSTGRLTYTLTLQNTSTRTLSVDTISDVLPAGATYQTGTTTGVTTANPTTTAGTLTWSGPYTVAGGSRVTLSYQVQVTPTSSSLTYTNNATAKVGPTLIDTTLDTTDNQPARATATVNSGFVNDTTAPTITLTAQDGAGAAIANSGSTSSTSATMVFTANESAQFTCSLDGVTPTACTSPRSLTGLSTRSHTFYVYATDAAGNVGTASITWTVTDATRPTVLSFTPVQATAKLSPIQFNLVFSEEVTGLATGDLAAVTSGSPGTWTVASVVGSGDSYVVTLSSASPGTSGTVQARLSANAVQDLASPANSGPAATVDSGTVTIRSTLAVEITAASPANAATSNATTATFSFAETAASYPASRFQCSMVATGNAAVWSECSSPVTYTGIASGSYTFSLKAEDVTVTVNNQGDEVVTLNATSATVTSAWTVDATPPVVAISAPTAGQTVSTATPTISGSCTTGDGVVTVRLYGGSNSTGSVLQTLTGACTAGAWSVTPTELLSATYTATARQTDAAGNATTTADRTFTVRTTAPVVSVGVPAPLIRTTSSPATGDCTTSQTGRTTTDVTITFTKGATTITTT